MTVLLLLACADPGVRVRTVTETTVIAPTGPAPTDPACAPTFDCDARACFVTHCTGRLWMGSPDDVGTYLEHPEIPVDVPTFQLMQTEVTVALYDACADEGACAPRVMEGPAAFCAGQRPADAVGCLDWFMATDVCAWLDARLPTAAEWEFAATDRGRDIAAPWGDAAATCDHARLGCEAGCDAYAVPGPTCDYPGGTSPLGVCDLIGNGIEWLEDWHVESYLDHPLDGSAPQPDERAYRSMRGGGVGSCAEPRAQHRVYHAPEFAYGGSSVRCARSVP